MLRVLVFDKELGRKVFAYGEDRRELRFRTVEEIAARVHPKVGADKNWPYIYLPEVAPAGKPELVPLPVPKERRTFKRLAQEQETGRRFKRLSR
jgi:hypothetical protein